MTCSGGGVAAPHNILSATHTDAAVQAVSQGSLIYGNSSPVWDELTVGTARQFLTVNAAGNEPEWTSFDWDFAASAIAADMVHSHANNTEGGQLDWDNVWSDAVHSHANAGEGGQLDWDDVWSDAVHDHTVAGEGGQISHDTALTGVSADDHHNAFIGLEDNAATPIAPAADDRIQVTDDGVINADAVGNTLALSIDQTGIDHGNLAGLADDDHPQYFLLAGETTNAQLHSGADLIVYSDGGVTEEARIDGATGYITTDRYASLGDADTYINMAVSDQIRLVAGNNELFRVVEAAQDEVIVNEGGIDCDFRVEGDNLTHAIFMLASSDDVGINSSSPAAQLHVDQSSATGAQPVLFLDQGDTSEQCIQFSSDGADQDINLFTINVTGTPTLLWDESEDAITWNKDIHISDKLVHLGDNNTYLHFPANDQFEKIVGGITILNIDTVPAQNVYTINENGTDLDFRIEASGSPSAFFVQGSSGNIGIGTTAPGALVEIRSGDLHLHNAVEAKLELRSSGDVAATESDIYADDQLGIAAETNAHIFIDALNSGTDDYFSIQKDAENLAAATELARVTEAPMLFLNETTNADMTIGVTLNQGANDDEIIALKSSDVAHGATDLGETDTYGLLKKANADAGGVWLHGLRDSGGTNAAALYLVGSLGENVDTTKTSAGRGIMEMVGTQITGTNYGNVVADGNVLVVRGRTGGAFRSLFTIDINGDLYADGGVASTDMVTLFDDYIDAELIRVYDLVRAPGQAIKSEWDRYLQYNEDTLLQAGILGGPLSDGGMLNVSRLQQLHNGAIWQNYTYIRRLEAALQKAGIEY